MDYKYIKQLLDRYWNCDTSLEEEEILRAFFSQERIPDALKQWRELFVYEQLAAAEDRLDERFDERVLAQISQDEPVKARTISLRERLMPLFKAAAIVAIVLTFTNAIQMSFDQTAPQVGQTGYNSFGQSQHETAVAKVDSTLVDTLQQSKLSPEKAQMPLK